MRHFPRNGKIARLPAAVREQINQKLYDNVPGPKIAAWLRAEHPQAVQDAGLHATIARNLSNWRKGGYADWLRQRERLSEMQLQREFAIQIARQSGPEVEAANLAIAASHIYEALMDFDLRGLQKRLRKKPEHYSLLIEALSKLSRAGLGERKLQLEFTKYRDQVAEQKRKIQAELDKAKPGGLTPENLHVIEEALHLL